MTRKNFIVISISLFFLLNLTLVGFNLINKTETKLESHYREIPLLAGETPASFVWNITWSNTKADWCTDMVISPMGNIYAVGTTEDTENRLLLVKYNKTGNLEWEIIFSSYAYSSGSGIALDAQENVYIVGTYSNDILLVKCNKTGSVQWSETWDGSATDVALDLALDSSNNIYIVGYTNSYSQDNVDILLMKYSNSGSLIWNKTVDVGEDGAFDQAREIRFDSEDNFYIVGNGDGIVLAKFNDDGIQQWMERWGNEDMTATSFSIDSDGCFYVSAYESVPSKNRDVLFVKFNITGMEWVKRWGDIYSDESFDVEVDSLDNVYLTWVQGNSFVYSGISILSCYNTSGDLFWTKTWSGHASSLFNTIAFDSLEDLYLGGRGTISLGDYPEFIILKYDTSLEMKIKSPMQDQFFGFTPPNYTIGVLGGFNNTIWYEIENNGNNYYINNLEGTINETEWLGLGEGPNLIKFYVMNSTGTIISSSIFVKKDTTPPLSLILLPPNYGINNVTESTSFSFNSTDWLGSGVSLIRYKINNSGWITYTAPFKLDSYPSGFYNITYQAIDNVGNIENPKSIFVILTRINPLIPGDFLVLLLSIPFMAILIIIHQKSKKKLIIHSK